MRILITVSSLTRGSGLSRYVFSLCKLLKRANDVWVLTTHDNGTITYERNELNFISENIHLISLGCTNKVRKYFDVVHWINKIHPDIIINNYNAVVQYVLPFIYRTIKVIHVLHNDTFDFYRVGAINGNRICGWIAPTKAIANHFNIYTNNRYSDRITIISHGVEEAVHQKNHNKTLEIVYAGVLYEHKGVKILPDIIQRLTKLGIKLHFTIIGGGVLYDWLHERFYAEINNGIVTLTGVVDHDIVYYYMSKADIFLYPTHLDAFGLVIAEAMMNGAVPVVTLLPGITDNIITHGKDGYLIPKDNIDSFVSTINNLSNDKDLLCLLSKSAHNKSVTAFSFKQMKTNYENYLSSL